MSKDSIRRQIRFSSIDQIQIITLAVEMINERAETGVKATLNKFICDAAEKEATRIIEKLRSESHG